jgi:hypothetical protein
VEGNRVQFKYVRVNKTTLKEPRGVETSIGETSSRAWIGRFSRIIISGPTNLYVPVSKCRASQAKKSAGVLRTLTVTRILVSEEYQP